MDDILLDEIEAFADENDLLVYIEDEVVTFTNVENGNTVTRRLCEFIYDMFGLMDMILKELGVEQ